MAVRLPALRTVSALLQRNIICLLLVLISVSGGRTQQRIIQLPFQAYEGNGWQYKTCDIYLSEHYNYLRLFIYSRGWGSAVGIVTDFGLDKRGIEFDSWQGQSICLLHIVQIAYGAHPSSYPMGTGLIPVANVVGT
jgi:hypothetical protein